MRSQPVKSQGGLCFARLRRLPNRQPSCVTTVACVATVHFDRSSGLRLDGLGGDVHLETVNRSSLDGLLIHSSRCRHSVLRSSTTVNRSKEPSALRSSTTAVPLYNCSRELSVLRTTVFRRSAAVSLLQLSLDECGSSAAIRSLLPVFSTYCSYWEKLFKEQLYSAVELPP